MTGNTIILEGQHKYIDTKLQKHKFYDNIDTGKQCNVIYGIYQSADSFLQTSQRSWKFGMNTWNLVERLLTL